MLRLARGVSRVRRSRNARWLEGRAEKLPLPDGQVTVAWAISSVHHWDDRAAGLSEARRVLAAGGCLVLAERLIRPGARGHAAHGLTRNQADDFVGQLAAAGFVEVGVEARRAGHRDLVIVRGRKGSAG